jgi:tRNA-specific 2-thiouridylase
MREGFDYVATGHYARIYGGIGAGATTFSSRVPNPAFGGMPDSSNCRGTLPTSSQFHLLKGVDDSKDQSYFLYRLTQSQLAKTLFPIGGMKKSQVRTLAKEQNLAVAEKAESMGICFVGEVDINKFLKKQIEPKVGEVILKSTGEVIGRHEGVWFYTIGQRHGFEVTKYVGLPLYVVGKDTDQNQLIVGYYNDCLRDEFEVGDSHFISDNKPSGSLKCDVRIRHLGQMYKARVVKSTQDSWKVHLDESAFGVAPGQSAVFYQGDGILGGGIIQ